ncbi:MAG: M1 family metallopeptidase, partial [Gammaproteobacteria bacterium]
PNTAPTWQKRSFWSVASHEIGHMWTGDLVTVPWWNDIWLNEAFATWTAQRTMETLRPEWNPKMDGLEATEGAMRSDSLVSARAIRQPIENTGDIDNAFDGITYEKGSAVIHMFEYYLGQEKFRQGMHDYLQKYSYGSADLDGFLSAISTSTGQDIGPAFKTFLNQPGLPLVEASLEMKDGHPAVHLAQSRYLPLGSSGDPLGTQWQIPVCMHYPVHAKVVEQCYMLKDVSISVPLDTKTMPAWLMPNANGQGYYQWSLDKHGYDALIKSYRQLNPVEELSMAYSVGASFNAGKIDTAQTMQALAPLSRSKYEDVAEVPMSTINYAHEWLVTGKAKRGSEAYARMLYRSYDVARDFTRNGAPKDSNRREFEAGVAGFLAYTGQDSKVKKAADAAAMRVLGLDSHGKATGKPDFGAVAPEFVSVALDTAVRDKGAPVFDAAYENFKNAPNPFVRNTMLGAMTSTTDPALVKRLRDMVFEPGALRQNEIASVLFSQFGRPETRDSAWQWFQDNYDQITKVLPEGLVSRMPALAGVFCSDAKAEEVKAFFKDKMAGHPGSERVLAQAMESAHLCATRRAAQSPSAAKFFSRF